MRRIVIYLTRIYGLEIPSETQGFELLPGLQITNHFGEIKRHLDGTFFQLIGALETSDLLQAQAIVYTLGDPVSMERSGVTPNDFILRAAEYVSVFLHSLWLIKDHSAYPGLGFVQIRDGDDVAVHSNSLASSWTNASGQRANVSFSREELDHTAKLMQMWLKRFKYDFRLQPAIGSALLGSQGKTTRVGRAMYFSSIARNQLDLGVKIVNYCTALESLFSTDSVELSHKVAQRAAIFVSDLPEKRIATYDLIKKAYTVRSKVVHGDTLSRNEPQKVALVSQSLDDLVRSVLSRIFDSPELAKRFEASGEDLNRYFLKESFSKS